MELAFEDERCDECGFDATRWKERDCASLLAALGWWWREAMAPVDPELLGTDPAEDVWSALTYALHSRTVTGIWADIVEQVLVEDGVTLAMPAVPPVDETEDPAVFRDWMVQDLETVGARFAAVVKGAARSGWRHQGITPWEYGVTAGAGLRHAVHDASHHMFDISRNLAALGAGPQLAGTVAQVNSSGGGVPKLPLERAGVGGSGLEGDVQKERKHHGRPFQALSLWSAEVIERLQADGHPIGFGSAGENLTVRGIDWAALRPGTLLRIGDVLAEISFPATPCLKQARWFSDGDFKRIHYDRNPHLTRWYAWVREPGTIAAGTTVSNMRSTT